MRGFLSMHIPPSTTADLSTPQVVLVVDDDADIRRLVRLALTEQGFEVALAGDAPTALGWIEQHGLPHLAVIDIRMPGMDGLELGRRILHASDIPLIMLTAVDDEQTVLDALENISEDYLTKPFNPRELAARVKRVLRRMGSFAYARAPVVRVDDHLSLDLVGRKALIEGDSVALTPTETKLLHILMRCAPRTVSVDYLLRRLWPLDEVYEDTLRVHMHRLRRKIEPEPAEPRYVLTRRGVGYSFAAAS